MALLASGLIQSGWAALPFKISEQWLEYIKLERQFNIHFRRDQIFPGSIEDAFVPLQHWEVSDPHRRDRIDAYRSDNLSAEEKEILFAKTAWGGDKLRLFCTEIPQIISCRELIKEFGQPKAARWYGIRIQGQASFLVFDSHNPDRQPFTLKFGQGESVARNPVTLSDVFSQRIENFPAYAEIPSGFFPEKYLANVWLPSKKCFSMTFRSMDPIGLKLKPGQRIYPLAGFLAALSLEGAARRQWIEEVYLPALGKYSAITQQHFGIFVAGHTQNLNIVIDENQPNEVGFVARDARDMLNDPYTLEARGLSVARTSEAEPQKTSRVYLKWPTPEVGAEFPGHHTALFTGQSVNLFESDPSLYPKNTRIFLEHYLRESEIISGHKVRLSPEAQRILDGLNSTKSSFGVWNWRRVQSAMASVVEDIYQSLLQQKLPKLKVEQSWYSTSPMIELVLQCLERGDCQHFFPSGELKDLQETELMYYFYDGRIYLKDKDRVILATPLLSEKDKNFLRKSRVTRKQIGRFKMASTLADQKLLESIFSLELKNPITLKSLVTLTSSAEILRIRQSSDPTIPVFAVRNGKLIAGIMDPGTGQIHWWMQIQVSEPGLAKWLTNFEASASCEESLQASPAEIDD